ncbi:hypothetical protein AGDE_03809 [Angomonas deanei]|uniref:Uncharacterized protein n=1 Tax=Angomonas deanei TaxID=59799 RepID=A0A7G2C0U9_9TRYP|nr:hypothetical protein AGDE_03809 [Angomonas deanei]CAD2212811.1 hypothetical protein, conserved [Angomonas deanei]|eukprot:EPY40119.1 hypothetical protein AGDE_03809 [Angomonas deanei]
MMCCSASQASNQTPESPADSIGKKSALTRNKSSFGDVFGASTLSETIVIPFSVNVFVSFLQLSTTELQATMTVKKTQLIDFTVSNLSNRPLPFVIRMQNFPVKGVELELYESEHFEEPKFGRRLYLEAHGSMKMSLMARTASNVTNSQFQATLQCDNLRDRRNTSLIYVNINVVRELQGDIVSLPDTSVNFGDVYRGGKTTAEISLNVLGKEDVGVKLGDAHQWKCEGEVCLMKDKTAVDETTISSGQGKSITLVYQPSYNATNNKDTAKVQFELELLFWSGSDRQQKVVVRCFAVLYTSTMTVTPSNINFGDCHVGQCKRYTFSIENQSPLPGSVIVQFRSKIISIEGAVLRENTGREVNEEFFIAPSSSLPITLRITPQRVNPTYHKELFITNASNPKEERLVVTIDANNMPPSEAKLHNELYSWDPITPGMEKREENTLVALTNTPLLVPYLVQSKVDYPLNLSVRSTSAEVELFRFSDPTRAEQMETIEADFRFLVQGRNIAEDGNKVLEGNAERVEELRKELIKILRDGEVIQKICVEPLSSVKVYAIIIRTSFASEMITKEDGLMISIDSIEAPRFVRLSYKLCSTSFELLGQRTKNFGEVNIGTKKTTKLSLVNRCKSLLYVCLSKSRSVTAGHIRMGGSDKQTIWLTIRPLHQRNRGGVPPRYQGRL